MWDDLVPITLFLSFAFIVVGLAKIIADARIRRRMIEAGLTPEQMRAVLTGPQRPAERSGILKWALLMGSVGLALVVLQFLPFGAEDPLSYGVLLLGAAGGLFAYVAVRPHGWTA